MAEVFVVVASYRNVDEALSDYAEVTELYRQGVIDTYDAALVTRGVDGTVHVSKREKPTQKAAWTGAVVGAVVGVLFPPAIIPMAAAGGVTGGLIGHMWAGLSRADLKDLGETLDYGTAAIIVIGKTSLADRMAKATAKAARTIEKQIQLDAQKFDKELADVTQGRRIA